MFRARYDAAQTTDENAKHWANADYLSAAAANSPDVRGKLRSRARLERDNNSYCSGMVETLARHIIGTGPRLQVKTRNRDANRRIADEFEDWAEEIGLAEKLQTACEAKIVDGESFLVMANNPRLATAVKLDLQDVEADQVTTPDLFVPTPLATDGIVYDAYRNPIEYHVLEAHPGDMATVAWNKYNRIPAHFVLHWFKRRRPGQLRGVPEITAALPLFALHRRFGLATVSAAEIAALFAAIVKTTMQPDDDTEALTAFDTQAIERGMMTALPEGYDVTQLKAEQPTTTYEMFDRANIRQIARCIHMPRSIAAGDSADLNYSSGQLDHQVYRWMIGLERYTVETRALKRIFREWLSEARKASPWVADAIGPGVSPRISWNWDGFKHADPLKESLAQYQRLLNGTTSLQRECNQEGYSRDDTLDEIAEDRRACEERGIPYPGDPIPVPAADSDSDSDQAEANRPTRHSNDPRSLFGRDGRQAVAAYLSGRDA